jgi:hypothetical protein
VPNFDDEDLGYVDFLDIDDILLDYHNNDSNEFYADEENYMFTCELWMTLVDTLGFISCIKSLKLGLSFNLSLNL